MCQRFGAGAACIGVFALLAGGLARAATSTASMLVTANVPTTCSVSAAPLPFGLYSLVTPATANTAIAVLCSAGTPYSVGLDAGTGAGASGTTRAMTQVAGAASLAYNLYSDNAMSTPWGGTVGINTVAGIGTGSGQTLTVYGRIAAGQNVPVGAYADTVTVTLTY
jgi:spore coat protein U-like protein